MKIALFTLIAFTNLHSSALAKITTQLIGGHFKLPVVVSQPAGENNRLWIVEKKGAIRILDRKTGKASNFLNIIPRVGSKGNEEGLGGNQLHLRRKK